MKEMKKEFFGLNEDGSDLLSYTLENDNGTSITAIPYGATITSLKTADRNGKFEDIVLGYDTQPQYAEAGTYFGAFVGRYANRIEGASFFLDKKLYKLEKNDGNNTLHGGFARYSHRQFEVEAQDDRIIFTLFSPDGDGGYPGNLQVSVTYCLSEDDKLIMDYKATCDALTIANFTNHSYFNLNGHASGDILGHMLKINADRITENNSECVPTGGYMPVTGTALDFRTPKPVGKDIKSREPQVQNFGGYDNNFVLKKDKGFDVAAVLYSEQSGRKMTVVTTKPGMQLYTGNKIDNITGKDGAIYKEHAGLCLETGYFPGGPDIEGFPSVIMGPNEPYHHITVFEFGVGDPFAE